MLAAAEERQVVIFTGKWFSPSTVEHIEALAEAFPTWHFTILQEKPTRRSWGPYLRMKWKQWLNEPVSYPLEVLAKLMARGGWQKSRSILGGQPLPRSLEKLLQPNLTYRSFPSFRSPEPRAYVAGLKPWLGIALSAPILKPDLFRIPDAGTINLHKSLLPAYRGMPPGFWELHDGARQTGVTVHWVDEGLDTGKILKQMALPVPPFSTPPGLAAELDLLGSQVLVATLAELAGGELASKEQPATPGRTNRRPSWLLAREVGRRLWRRQEVRRTVRERWARLLGDCLFLLFLYAWVPLRNALRAWRGQARGAVLVYHRVSDSFRDSVTVGVEQFQRQLRTIKKHYDVVDLPTLLAGRGQSRTRPCVAITFDDGYEDNLLAGLLLRREGLPCTFFLSTRVVGSDRAFPHDLKKLGRCVPALRWDQVQRLIRWGFHAANHTATHANLAALSSLEALEEISTARADLQRELGEGALPDCLAYPYGLPSDITDEVRLRLQTVGVRYCCSCSGGTNPPHFDPLDVRRQGVDANFNDLRLRAAIEGWTGLVPSFGPVEACCGVVRRVIQELRHRFLPSPGGKRELTRR